MRGTVSSHKMAEDANAEKAANAKKQAENTASSHTLLEGRLGYKLESALLVRALTHRSYAYENGGLPTNERLEFLGDSVLGLVVTDTLYRTHPDLPEGQLAKLRAAVVNSRALAEVSRGLELGSFIRLGRGEEGTGGRDKASILADTLEAVIGAVYLDQGLDAAGELVHRLFDPLIEKSSNLGAGLDWKTSLQELTATESLGVPEYLVTESGPDHEKTLLLPPASEASRTAPAPAAARRKRSSRPRSPPGARSALPRLSGSRRRNSPPLLLLPLPRRLTGAPKPRRPDTLYWLVPVALGVASKTKHFAASRHSSRPLDRPGVVHARAARGRSRPARS